MAIPFLRWAGGKSWLVAPLQDIIGNLQYNNYHEPFLGGGAIFFSLEPNAQGHQTFLSDMNKDLITTYRTLQDTPLRVIHKLQKFENSEEQYYEIRKLKSRGAITQSARFIYLNHTSYNGLYRVNKAGQYNVPYGHRKNLTFNEERFLDASRALQGVHISQGDFVLSLDNIHKNDLIFLDPPYTVSHNQNGFIEYNRDLFSLNDQHRLNEYINEIKNRGAFYILTNAAHETIDAIFRKEDDRKVIVERNSLIGGKNARRAKIQEFVFTNIPEGV
ncbi:DNA adenine methylase [Pygmaiobacter massiliensis]|uniref:DNA adenine methylase n=1 Tax=Pygmaiobacter massiliensis TaxID=1917873 RepID=UPI000C79C944|nr:Dam family site-specific DNA-(adenine-N6)-methyltransferase [Pygmaiobacter massiliensis]